MLSELLADKTKDPAVQDKVFLLLGALARFGICELPDEAAHYMRHRWANEAGSSVHPRLESISAATRLLALCALYGVARPDEAARRAETACDALMILLRTDRSDIIPEALARCLFSLIRLLDALSLGVPLSKATLAAVTLMKQGRLVPNCAKSLLLRHCAPPDYVFFAFPPTAFEAQQLYGLGETLDYLLQHLAIQPAQTPTPAGGGIKIEGESEMHQLQGSFEFREKGESGLAMEGTAINKEFFEFMARMTQVEWGLSLQSGGAENYPGYIKTSYLQGELNDAIIPGYDTLIHNHGNTYADVSEERYKVVDFCSYPSQKDLSAIAAAEKMGYSHFYIYNELQKSSALRYNQYVSGNLSMEERAVQLNYQLK